MSEYPEPLVARSLGVKKSRLADARKAQLRKGADWELVGAVVVYTADGLKKLCGVLGLDAARVPAAAAPTAETPPAAAQGLEEATAPNGEAISQQDSSVEERRAHNSEVAGSIPAPASTFARRDPVATADQVAAAVEELAKKSAPVDIEVTGIPGNTIIVHGRLEGKPVTVRVKHNATFIPGLWLKATPINGGSYYAQVGSPPRWKGDRYGFNKPTVSP